MESILIREPEQNGFFMEGCHDESKNDKLKRRLSNVSNLFFLVQIVLLPNNPKGVVSNTQLTGFVVRGPRASQC